MPNSFFDNVKVLETENCDFHCECGQPLRSLDGDWLDVDIGKPVRGVGWMVWKWNCRDCGIVFSLSLGVVSNPQDEMIAIDNYQEAKTTRHVLIEKDGHKVFGIEQFDVNHQNPIADFASRHYDCMAEYNIGPTTSKKKLLERSVSIAGLLINRVQIDLPLANKIPEGVK